MPGSTSVAARAAIVGFSRSRCVAFASKGGSSVVCAPSAVAPPCTLTSSPCVGKRLEVAPDGHVGNAEVVHQLAGRGRAALPRLGLRIAVCRCAARIFTASNRPTQNLLKASKPHNVVFALESTPIAFVRIDSPAVVRTCLHSTVDGGKNEEVYPTGAWDGGDARTGRHACALAFALPRPLPAARRRHSRAPAASCQLQVFSWWTGGGEAAGLAKLITIWNRATRTARSRTRRSPAAPARTRRPCSPAALGNNPPDSFQGHAGAELLDYIKAGQVQPIDFIYKQYELRKFLPSR